MDQEDDQEAKLPGVAAKIDRMLRRLARWGAIAGLAVALLIVSPLVSGRGVLVGADGTAVSVRNEEGALAIGVLGGAPTPFHFSPARPYDFATVVRRQFQTGSIRFSEYYTFDRRSGRRRALMGLSAEWIQIPGSRGVPAWRRDELAIPAWLLGAPGAILFAVRGFRYLDAPRRVKRTAPGA